MGGGGMGRDGMGRWTWIFVGVYDRTRDKVSQRGERGWLQRMRDSSSCCERTEDWGLTRSDAVWRTLDDDYECQWGSRLTCLSFSRFVLALWVSRVERGDV